MDNITEWVNPTDLIIYHNKDLTYEEYKILVEQVKESSIGMMCSSMSTAAIHVVNVYRKVFAKPMTHHYNTMASRMGTRFNRTGD